LFLIEGQIHLASKLLLQISVFIVDMEIGIDLLKVELLGQEEVGLQLFLQFGFRFVFELELDLLHFKDSRWVNQFNLPFH
jgi:hypothetical protein